MEQLIHDGVLTLPSGISIIENEAFAGQTELTEVILPDTVREIGAAAFAGCENLRRIVLPEGLHTIGQGAFLDCTALREIVLPESLHRIESMAFWNSGLERVSVPVGVEYIGETAFWSCENLRRADVLGAETVIEKNAFGSNYALIEGYMAPGYPAENSAPAELLYTLLWCSCPERHNEITACRAEKLIREQEGLIMERILKYNNVAAMTGLVHRQLLKRENIDTYLRQSLAADQRELTALLLEAKGQRQYDETEFEL